VNVSFLRRKHGSSWLSVTIGLVLLALGAVLWLGLGGAPAAAVNLPVSASDPAPEVTDVITIGVAAPLSGGVAFLGWPQANAVQLAVDQVNAAGGVDIGGVSYQVVLVRADDQCSSAQAPLAAQQLLDAGAVGVIGHTCSGATMAAEPIYAAAGLAMISPSSTSPAVTQQGYDIAFRTCPHDGSPPAQLARYARRGLGLASSSFVAFSDAPLGSAAYYSSTFTALAGTITGFHLLSSTDEFTATLTDIKHNEHPQVIYYADYDASRAGLFSRVSHGVGMDDVVIAWTPWDVGDGTLAQYQNAAGATAADSDLAGMEHRRQADMPGWPAFLADYQAAGFPNYGGDPTLFGPHAYDAARILLAAIDRADSTDPAAVRDEVANTKNHVGVVGTYEGFDGNGDVQPQWGWLMRNWAGKWSDVELYSWGDGFETPALGPLWSWVREDPTHWSLTDRPGWMRITTQPGSLVGDGEELASMANDEKNLLLTPAPPGDFFLTVRLEFTPTASFHQAGLIIYQDDDNYVRLSRGYVYGEQYVEMTCEVNATADVTGVLEAATHLELQLQKRGDIYEGYYSLDGEHWIPVGRYTASLGTVQAGLGAAQEIPQNLEAAPDIPADFTKFQMIGGLPRRDYGWSDHFDKGLNAPWAWVREDATHWSLDDRPDHMQITTQEGSLFGSGGDAHNLLLRPAPPTDWQIGTRVLFTPTQDFQIAGLLMYADDDNWMLFGRAFCDTPDVCVANGIYFDHEEAGSVVGTNHATPVPLPYLANLQVARAGSDYWGFYGEDGIYWTLIGHHVAGPGFIPTRVGLAAYNQSSEAAEIDAAFDSFWLAADSIRAFLPLAVKTYQP